MNDPKTQNTPNSESESTDSTRPGLRREQTNPGEEHAPTATRHDLQLGRRLFHFSTGSIIATLYYFFLSHQQIVYFLGTCACLVYLFEQIRISYPEVSQRFASLTKLFLRAEEHLKESASVPYAMGILLTIITFPKAYALIAVYTLAIADPLAGIVGIHYGKKKLINGKSLEGSLAFFTATFVCAATVLLRSSPQGAGIILLVSMLIALVGSLLEIIPFRIDDNLTIPIFIAMISSLTCNLLGVTPF